MPGRGRLCTRGNGARTRYAYDAANRVTLIRHETAGGDQLLEMVYTYTATDLISTVMETDAIGQACLLTFDYDARERLVHETRCESGGMSMMYDVSYTYDQGGNRIGQFDSINGILTSYQYDPAHNRLLSAETRQMGDGTVLESTTYTYEPRTGNPVLIVRKPVSEQTYYGTWLSYAGGGTALWMAAGRTWELDPLGNPVNAQTQYVKEFRYDSGRERYIVRDRDPVTLAPLPGALWSDYAAEQIYGDYAVEGQTSATTELASYIPGLAEMRDGDVAYISSDHIGSNRLMTNSSGSSAGSTVYSGFGQTLYSDGSTNRYGYAGAWGYQRTDDMSFLHVGARYYDPGLGRFLMRDPSGIGGGLNVYEYANSTPTLYIDPTGEFFTLPDWILEPIVRWIGPQTVLDCTGGAKKTYLDCVGNCIAKHHTAILLWGIGGGFGGAGSRIPINKRGIIPGEGAGGDKGSIASVVGGSVARKIGVEGPVINSLKKIRTPPKAGAAGAIISAGGAAAYYEQKCMRECSGNHNAH